MPNFCAVVKCGNRGMRDNVSFFSIPSVLHFKHNTVLNELSAKRREKWIAALRRDDLTETKLKYARICSKHFISGHPAKLVDEQNPDWVPSVAMGYGLTVSKDNLSSFHRREKRAKIEINEVSKQVDSAENLPEVNEEIESGVENTSSLSLMHSQSSQTDMDMAELSLLFAKLSTHEDNLKKCQSKILSFESFVNDDVKTKYYTGLPTFNIFIIVVNNIKPAIKIHGKTSLTPQEQILLTLIKLRLNLDFKDLAYRFAVHPSTASTCFKNIIHLMYIRFKPMIIWPERDILLKTMPHCFKESFHENTTIIIDCFEIRCETPSNFLAAAQAWSNYKHAETIKYLIGITPQGTIAFISEGWGGRVSDKCLTQNSKFLNNLCRGDVVMADRGFLIKEFVELFQATVKVPAFTKGKCQLHPVDLEETRSIAHVRIHVERVIGLIRQKYRICYGIVPISLLSTKGDEALLDEIVLVCCALINLCPPVVPI